jgi:cyanate lyase
MSDELRSEIDRRRKAAGLTWKELADELGAPSVFLTAALMGQHPLPAELARAVGARFELDDAQVSELTEIPSRRIGETLQIPADPTLYRFFEALGVYGPALRALIHEEFGDGIMSAINFKVDLKRIPGPDGDRVEIVMDGKFLKYQW